MKMDQIQRKHQGARNGECQRSLRCTPKIADIFSFDLGKAGSAVVHNNFQQIIARTFRQRERRELEVW